jgi:Ca2+-binding EF-hand superfamily protein
VNTKKLAIALITSVGLSSAALASVAFAHGGHMRGHMRGELFEKIDANKDGKVTLVEAKAAEKARFTAIDTNKDGRLTTEELQAHRASKHGDKPANTERANKRKEHGAKFFANIDANGDGAIDAAESAAKAEKMFTRMDDNGDGVVTKDEIGRGRGDCGGHGRGDKPEHEGAAGSGPKDD